jgi:hypothetical protein
LTGEPRWFILLAMVDRDRRLSLKISDDEHAMLNALAERQGVSVSDVVRAWLREKYRETFGDTRPKRSRK